MRLRRFVWVGLLALVFVGGLAAADEAPTVLAPGTYVVPPPETVTDTTTITEPGPTTTETGPTTTVTETVPGPTTTVTETVTVTQTVTAPPPAPPPPPPPPPDPPPPLPEMAFVSPTTEVIAGQVIWSVTSPVAFAKIEFRIDGGPVVWTETQCPCYFNSDPNGRLDTTTLQDGNHVLQVDAYNASGTTVASGSKPVTVSNGGSPPPSPPPPPPPPPEPPPPLSGCTTTISTGLQAAITAAAAGSTICLNAGSYGSLTLNDVLKSADVTVRPADGATATVGEIVLNRSSHLNFDGTGGTLRIGGFDSDQSDSITAAQAMHHLTFRKIVWTDGVLIRAHGANQAILVDQAMFDNLGPALFEGRLSIRGYGGPGPVGVTVTNSHFGGSGANGCSDGVQIVGTTNGVVIGPGNEFTGIAQSGCSAHADPIQFVGADNTVVTGNYFHDNGDGSGGLMAGLNYAGTVVTNNVFVCSCAYPWSVFAGGADNWTIRHNTFAGGGEVRFEVFNGNSPSGNVVRDNVFTAGGGLSVGAAGYGTNDHNLNAGVSGTGNVTGAPIFVGGASPSSYAGYRLAVGSPGKGAASDGTDIGIP